MTNVCENLDICAANILVIHEYYAFRFFQCNDKETTQVGENMENIWTWRIFKLKFYKIIDTDEGNLLNMCQHD